MNIQNIAALTTQLASLGFNDISYSILKRISFKPQNFSLWQQINKGQEQLSFQLYFEKDNKQNAYLFIYYDASLQTESPVTDMTINGIDLKALQNRMAAIDWKSAFQLEDGKSWAIEDKASWENEQKIEAVVSDLETIEKVDEGKTPAMNLKFKYWANVPNNEIAGNINPPKSKLEVSQRFYVSHDQAGISVDEAFRFLKNRLLEKEIMAKKKASGKESIDNSEDDQRVPATGKPKKSAKNSKK